MRLIENAAFLARNPQTLIGYRTRLAEGERGTAQTIKLMRQLVDRSLSDQSFIRLTRDVVALVPAYDELGELEAVFNWVRSNIRYTKDPLNKETLYPPQELTKIKAGDCDDMSMLIGAMSLALGYPARVVTVAANSAQPREFSHVYTEVEAPVGSGNWVAMDAARPGAQIGRQPEHYSRKRAWSLIDESFEDLAGCARIQGLGSYGPVRQLGDDGGDGIDWSSILTQSIQQIPQDIAAVSGQPSALRSPYGTVATGPYASFQTPYSPGYGLPQAGYSATLSSSGWLMPLLIIGGLLLVSRGRG